MKGFSMQKYFIGALQTTVLFLWLCIFCEKEIRLKLIFL